MKAVKRESLRKEEAQWDVAQKDHLKLLDKKEADKEADK